MERELEKTLLEIECSIKDHKRLREREEFFKG